MPQVTAPLTEQQALAIGGRRWTHPRTGAVRVYLNDDVFAPLIGLEYDRYRSGNVSSATLRGEDISNARATYLLAARCWVEDGTLRVYLSDEREISAQQLLDAIIAAAPVLAPSPGDLALHQSNQLDEREVTRVDGDQVWIRVGGVEAGPFPASNYTYRSPESSA